MDYTIRRAPESLGEPTADWDAPLWAAADTLEIAQWRWEDSGHHPTTHARVLYDDDGLAAIFRVLDHGGNQAFPLGGFQDASEGVHCTRFACV